MGLDGNAAGGRDGGGEMVGGGRAKRRTRPSAVRLLQLGVLMAFVVVGGVLLARGSGEEAPGTTVRIASPTADAETTAPVPLKVDLQGTTLGSPAEGLDHLHVAVDGGQPLALYETPQVSLPLVPGPHTLAVELAGPDHQPITAVQSVSFVVVR